MIVIHGIDITDPTVHTKLDEIKQLLLELKQQGGVIMGRSEEVLAIVSRLDSATNELASDLQALRDKIAAGTVGDAELAELDRVTRALEALGHDPENPVPPSA